MHDDRGVNLGIRRWIKGNRKLFCKRTVGMPSIATDGVCVRELGRTVNCNQQQTQ
jgi:hypothetical protein